MKRTKNLREKDDDMLPEYDFRGKKGVRGKYAKALKQGYSIRVTNEDGTVTVKQFVPRENTIVLDPDVKAYFPDSKSVNRALRSLIELIPEKSGKQIAEKKARYKVK
ncbi:MAG: hypothetical protein L0287_14505 [Anaerolineae bacterium]|nr:hypothetical protein [Anaerolineae bacterium]MCI0609690.1 hypothetical protein [Anaerolineae bacterium]